jgi:hypothetical protein
VVVRIPENIKTSACEGRESQKRKVVERGRELEGGREAAAIPSPSAGSAALSSASAGAPALFDGASLSSCPRHLSLPFL